MQWALSLLVAQALGDEAHLKKTSGARIYEVRNCVWNLEECASPRRGGSKREMKSKLVEFS